MQFKLLFFLYITDFLVGRSKNDMLGFPQNYYGIKNASNMPKSVNFLPNHWLE